MNTQDDEEVVFAKTEGREWRGDDMFAPIDSKKPYLLSLDVLDNLLRGFLIKVADIRGLYNSDNLDDKKAVQAVADLCKEYADILQGNTEEYSAAPWNSEDQLGAYISTLFVDVPKEEAVNTYLLRMAQTFTDQVLIPVEEDQIDEEVATFRIDYTIEDAAKAFIGLPNHPDE